jgi:hypothetical protein
MSRQKAEGRRQKGRRKVSRKRDKVMRRVRKFTQ